MTEYLRKEPRIDKIALWGRSMGAVTALLYLPEDNHITSVILDSPFKSLKGLGFSSIGFFSASLRVMKYLKR